MTITSDDARRALQTDPELQRQLVSDALAGYFIAIMYDNETVLTNSFEQAEAFIDGRAPISRDGARPIAVLFTRFSTMTAESLRRGERIAAAIELLCKPGDPREAS